MLISQAFAHGSTGNESVGGFIGPLIFLAVIVIAVLYHLAKAKWRRRRQERDGLAQ